MIPPTPQFEAALHIVRTLRAAGHEAYLAGGCVRDLLLGREPSDYDVATSATPDLVLEMFPRTFAVGAHFGVVLVASEADGSEDSTDAKPQFVLTEVATFRSDGAYSDGRHPDEVRYTKTAHEDVQRRDFTINGLLLDPLRLLESPNADPSTPLRSAQDDQDRFGFEVSHPSHKNKDVARVGHPIESTVGHPTASQSLRGAVLDYVGGLADLDAGVIRAIGEPRRRFEEDQLRLLRGVRFAARFGFALEAQTATAMRSLSPRIHAMSRERVRDELTKMLTEGKARRAFELLDETGLLVEVLPEVAKMRGVAQPPQFHPEGDVWIHTLMLLEQLEAGCAPTLAWGALLHDVGKPPTFRVAPDRIRFDGHVEVGVAMGAEICRRFRFSNDDTHQILALIDNHMRFADAPRMRASTLKRFFRLENFPEHLALHRMDCLAAHANLDIYNFVLESYSAMPEETVRPEPLLTGRELIAAGYAPGPQFKEMLQAVEDAQLEGAIGTADEALALVRERFGKAASSR
jgi:putative nucleotidyltransferase with HDIG domain